MPPTPPPNRAGPSSPPKQVVRSVSKPIAKPPPKPQPKPVAAPYSAHDLMADLLDMTTQRWIEPERFLDIASRVGAKATAQRIFFLTELRERIRQIPLKLFPAIEIRQKMLDSLQQALDIEIAKEEVL